MSDSLVAKRYAKALHETGARAGKTQRVDEDIALVAETLKGSRDLRLLFQSPIVSRERKSAVVNALFGEHVDRLTLDFVTMLVTKGREGVFAQIAEAYQSLRDEESGVVAATAKTPVAISAESEAGLRRSLEQKIGKKIRLGFETDASLLGGLVVRVGDIVYDGSVSNRLSKLREQFG